MDWVQAVRPPSGGGPGSMEVRVMVLLRTWVRTFSWEAAGMDGMPSCVPAAT